MPEFFTWPLSPEQIRVIKTPVVLFPSLGSSIRGKLPHVVTIGNQAAEFLHYSAALEALVEQAKVAHRCATVDATARWS